MSDTHGSLYLRSRLFLAFGWRVMRHTLTLILALIGAAILQVPAWVRPLLNPSGQKMLDQCSMLPARDYPHLAYAVLIGGFVLACFFAWEEERGEVTRQSLELAKLRVAGPDLVGNMATTMAPSKADSNQTVIQCVITIANRGNANSIVKNWQFDYECEKRKVLQFFSPMYAISEPKSSSEEFEKEDKGVPAGGERIYRKHFMVDCPANEITQVYLTFQDVNDRPFTIKGWL